jgi:three-Cys-motif partner protein
MSDTPHLFGGNWTDEKLERVRRYLVAYTTALKNQPFRIAYIDAFAGTGYRAQPKRHNPNTVSQNSIFGFSSELAEEESQQFLDGSARIALQVEPRFDKYIFIEKHPKRFAELTKLKDEFPDKRDDIILEPKDANEYLQKLCRNVDWKTRRAVLFLDPYGMQVEWRTIAAIGETKAIDLWILFPLGVAVNRMLTRSGKISNVWRRKLDIMFGDTGWYEEFYESFVTNDIFGRQQTIRGKVATFNSIGQYFVRRLKTVFFDVAENPRPLYNSRNNPLFLLCFAVGNARGAPIAMKIANHILKS